jgi:predicted RecB family nuclease
MIAEKLPTSWNELIFAFIKCDLKAYLKLQGRSGHLSDIEHEFNKRAKIHRDAVLEKIHDNYDKSYIVDSPQNLFETLRSRAQIITNSFIIYEDIPLHIDALFLNKHLPFIPKKPSEIELVIFNYKERLSIEDKDWAICISQLITKAIKAVITKVTLIHGNMLRKTTIVLANRKQISEKILKFILKMRIGNEPPKLRLKANCKTCEFMYLCYKQAQETDDLSLIQAITEKEIKKLNAKGIFTTTQYSYTFQPRRQGSSPEKKRPCKHNLALQAMAKRTNTIYIAEKPEIPSSETAIYVDIEGIPDQKLYYLLGLRVITKNSIQSHYFWADSKSEEQLLWTGLVRVLKPLKGYLIYHYGAYEIHAFRALAKRYDEKCGAESWITNVCFNVLSAIYGHVHFPTLSNSLKDIASILGFTWTDSNVTGIQSLAWRYAWEDYHSSQLKQKLITYNQDDCQALQLVTEALRDLPYADSNNKKLFNRAVSSVKSLETEIRPYSTLIKKKAVFPDLLRINECSYYSYQRARVEVRMDPKVRRSIKRAHQAEKNHRVNVRIVLDRLLECPNCGSETMNKHGKLRNCTYDLKITQSGIKRWIVETIASRYRCENCRKAVSPEKYYSTTRQKYGSTLMAWVVYKHISHTQSYGTIVEELRDVFGYIIPRGSLNHFKHDVASHCRSSYLMVKENILQSHVIYVDETKAKKKRDDGYIWVFTSPNTVCYFYRETREGDFLQELLIGFKGVLVSDFYSAYDSVQCKQQKCLIHLVRDINDDIFKNPFDEELKSLARGLTDVLCPIVETIDKFGLRKRNLRKHMKAADKYCDAIIENEYTSELAQNYQRRITKYADRMFTFLRYDNVSWNNNSAEHAIKRYANLRRCFSATSTEDGIGEYLVLLSICETLRRNGFNFLDFLKENKFDINQFLAKR